MTEHDPEYRAEDGAHVGPADDDAAPAEDTPAAPADTDPGDMPDMAAAEAPETDDGPEDDHN